MHSVLCAGECRLRRGTSEHFACSVVLEAGFFPPLHHILPLSSFICLAVPGHLPDACMVLEGLAYLLSLRAEATAKALQTCYQKVPFVFLVEGICVLWNLSNSRGVTGFLLFSVLYD